MKKIQCIFGTLALIAFPTWAQAQTQAKDTTLSRTVVVEQEYNPDIMDASKVNVLPKVAPPTVSKKTVEYDATLVPAGNIPASTMQAYTGVESQDKAQRGYARLGYGNYGNLDARANYLFILPNSDKLNLNFHMNGMDGKLDMPGSDEKWSARYYRTRAGMDYVHSFRKVDLNVAGNFGLSNFNYMPYTSNNKQKFLSGDVHFGVKSTGEELPLQFHAETNLLFYERQHDFQYENAQEAMVRTKAGAMGAISGEQYVGVELAMDNVFYKNNEFDDYTSVELNPYYLYQNDDWKIRLGAHVDFAFGFGKKFRVAPDVTAQYIFSDSYILYAQATGGRRTNDFRRLEMISPYSQTIGQLDATYEQLNAALGFRTSPVTGLWFNLYGGYQDLKNNLATIGISGVVDQAYSNSYLLPLQANMHNIYAGAEISYSYKDIISFSASGVYRDWKTAKTEDNSGELLLAYMPSFEAKFNVDIRPIPSVLVNLGYQHTTREKVGDQRVDPVGNLYLGGSYEVFKDISIYVRANNLLNKNYQYYWGYPTEGINFMGGVSFRF
ncbi:TonB-dependent receptor [Bacteroides oleiciplenus]|uniref:TonB-dependent receptor n=1 Tax=Bacteroides oleiciplenus TaxID=626931 RepID=A0A3E5BGB3_9BACE|nr:TonB-dependent receptor [Bacteroides oleiciplenus]RGN36630.1 TonB-dependent receptor [Bacteroides oleiciplenus]